MKVSELTEDYLGRTIVVTAVAPSEPERRGWVNDTERLVGCRGVLTYVSSLQARVDWPAGSPARGLYLASDDEVEMVD